MKKEDLKEVVIIEELKTKFGEIKEIAHDQFKAYFRKPDLRIWRFALKAYTKSATEFKRSMAVNCFVGGDRELLESPYIEDIAETINEFIEYTDAEVEKDGNAYRVSVLGKSCKLKPVTIEITTQSERDNEEDIPFLTQQYMLDRMWIEGDEELRDKKNLDYYMPVLRVLKNLRKKHLLTIKNV